MPFKINLFGIQNTEEARKAADKDLIREWQYKLRSEARTVDRSIRVIEREEEKVRKQIKESSKRNGDARAINTMCKTLVRSQRGKDRLYSARARMHATASELQAIGATMRMADSMKGSTEVLQMMNSLANIPETHEAMASMRKEMFKAGLVEEIVEESMEAMDDPELEEAAAEEVERVLDELAVDAEIKLKIVQLSRPAGTAVAPAASVSVPAAVPDSAGLVAET